METDHKRKQEEFWMALINKYEKRNKALEEQGRTLQAQIHPKTLSSEHSFEESACSCSPCLARNSLGENSNSLFSLSSADLRYMLQLKELLEQEKEKKQKIEMFQHGNLLNGTKTEIFRECQCNNVSDDPNSALLEENKRLTDELKDLKLEMKQCIENIEGPITRQIEKEKNRNKSLENQLLNMTKNAASIQQTLTSETEELKYQLDDVCKELSAVAAVNGNLQKELSSRQSKCKELEQALIDQKLAEAESLKKFKNPQNQQSCSLPQTCLPCQPSNTPQTCLPCPPPPRSCCQSSPYRAPPPCQPCQPCPPSSSCQQPPPCSSCICQCLLVKMLISQEASGDKKDTLLDIGKRLSAALQNVDQCPCCQNYIPPDLMDTCKCIKEIANLVGAKEPIEDSTVAKGKKGELGPEPRSITEPKETQKPLGKECTCQTEEEIKKSTDVQAQLGMLQSRDGVENAVVTEKDETEEATTTEKASTQEAVAEVLQDKADVETEAVTDTTEGVTETLGEGLPEGLQGEIPVEGEITGSIIAGGDLEQEQGAPVTSEENDETKTSVVDVLPKTAEEVTEKPTDEIICSALRSQLEQTCKAICARSGVIERESEEGIEGEIVTEIELHGDGVYAEVNAELLLVEGGGDDTQVTTTITQSGTLEVVTEGPAGIIETTMVYTDSGNVEILTEITEYEEDAQGQAQGRSENVLALEGTTAVAPEMQLRESGISQGTPTTYAAESAYSADISAISSKITDGTFQPHQTEEELSGRTSQLPYDISTSQKPKLDGEDAFPVERQQDQGDEVTLLELSEDGKVLQQFGERGTKDQQKQEDFKRDEKFLGGKGEVVPKESFTRDDKEEGLFEKEFDKSKKLESSETKEFAEGISAKEISKPDEEEKLLGRDSKKEDIKEKDVLGKGTKESMGVLEKSVEDKDSSKGKELSEKEIEDLKETEQDRTGKFMGQENIDGKESWNRDEESLRKEDEDVIRKKLEKQQEDEKSKDLERKLQQEERERQNIDEQKTHELKRIDDEDMKVDIEIQQEVELVGSVGSIEVEAKVQVEGPELIEAQITDDKVLSTDKTNSEVSKIGEDEEKFSSITELPSDLREGIKLLEEKQDSKMKTIEQPEHVDESIISEVQQLESVKSSSFASASSKTEKSDVEKLAPSTFAEAPTIETLKEKSERDKMLTPPAQAGESLSKQRQTPESVLRDPLRENERTTSPKMSSVSGLTSASQPQRIITEEVGPAIDTDALKKDVAEALMRANRNVLDALDDANKHVMGALETANRDVNNALAALEDLNTTRRIIQEPIPEIQPEKKVAQFTRDDVPREDSSAQYSTNDDILAKQKNLEDRMLAELEEAKRAAEECKSVCAEFMKEHYKTLADNVVADKASSGTDKSTQKKREEDKILSEYEDSKRATEECKSVCAELMKEQFKTLADNIASAKTSSDNDESTHPSNAEEANRASAECRNACEEFMKEQFTALVDKTTTPASESKDESKRQKELQDKILDESKNVEQGECKSTCAEFMKQQFKELTEDTDAAKTAASGRDHSAEENKFEDIFQGRNKGVEEEDKTEMEKKELDDETITAYITADETATSRDIVADDSESRKLQQDATDKKDMGEDEIKKKMMQTPTAEQREGETRLDTEAKENIIQPQDNFIAKGTSAEPIEVSNREETDVTTVEPITDFDTTTSGDDAAICVQHVEDETDKENEKRVKEQDKVETRPEGKIISSDFEKDGAACTEPFTQQPVGDVANVDGKTKADRKAPAIALQECRDECEKEFSRKLRQFQEKPSRFGAEKSKDLRDTESEFTTKTGKLSADKDGPSSFYRSTSDEQQVVRTPKRKSIEERNAASARRDDSTISKSGSDETHPRRLSQDKSQKSSPDDARARRLSLEKSQKRGSRDVSDAKPRRYSQEKSKRRASTGDEALLEDKKPKRGSQDKYGQKEDQQRRPCSEGSKLTSREKLATMKSKCDCPGDCECEICAPDKMAEKIKRQKAKARETENCTCLPDCQCSICSKYGKNGKHLPSGDQLDAEVQNEKTSVKPCDQELQVNIVDRKCHPPDCSCVSCLCDPCEAIKLPKSKQPCHAKNCRCDICRCKVTDKSAHPPECYCLDCLCEICPNLQKYEELAKCEATCFGEGITINDNKDSAEKTYDPFEKVKKPSNFLPKEAEVVKQDITKMEGNVHAEDCICPICQCPGADLVSVNKKHGENCDCPECQCEKCPGIDVQTSQIKPDVASKDTTSAQQPQGSSVNEASEQLGLLHGDSIQGSERPDSVQQGSIQGSVQQRSLPQGPVQGSLHEASEQLGLLHGDSIQGSVRPGSVQQSSLQQGPVQQSSIQGSSQLSSVHPQELEVMTDAILQQKLLEMENENSQRKQEMNELKNLLDQVRCACAVADGNSPRQTPQKAALEATMSGLQTTLSNLQEKCKAKDRMIESLTQELRLRASSKVFNDMLKNIAASPPTNVDYDRMEICTSLPRPKESYTYGRPSHRIQKCEHPDFPNCACVNSPPQPSLPKCSHPDKISGKIIQKVTCKDTVIKPDDKNQKSGNVINKPNRPDFSYCACDDKVKPLSINDKSPTGAFDKPKQSYNDQPLADNNYTEIGDTSASRAPQEDCLCSQGGIYIDPRPLEILEARRIAPDSLILKWIPPHTNLVTGYEIEIDGVLKSRVHSVNRTSAIVHGLIFNTNIDINLFAVSKNGRCLPPAHALFKVCS